MNTTLQSIQYRGDRADIKELYEKYNVGGFLAAREADERGDGASFRSQLMKDGVLLNEVLSPRIYQIVNHVQEQLELGGNFDVFCVLDKDINAFAHLDTSGETHQHVIGITSAALENLEDVEIASLLGHELGHFIFGHNRLLGLMNRDERNPSMTVLPYMGECLFLRWRKKSEISADRVGLIASQSFEATARTLIKAGFGLSEKNLNLNVDSLLKQIETIKDKPEFVEAAYRSHPLLPLRLKALHLFAEAVTAKAANLEQVETQIDGLFDWLKRYPRKPLHEAVMRIVALAGMKIVGAENDVDEEEIRTVIYVLHAHFTDDPEKELIINPSERAKRLKEAMELVRREGDDSDKGFIVSRLADIALADGKLLDAEAGLILETAEALGMPSRHAYGIIVGAAQSVGFRVDFRMKELTRQVRSQLMNTVNPIPPGTLRK